MMVYNYAFFIIDYIITNINLFVNIKFVSFIIFALKLVNLCVFSKMLVSQNIVYA